MLDQAFSKGLLDAFELYLLLFLVFFSLAVVKFNL